MRAPSEPRLESPPPAESPLEAARRLKEAARALGFDPVGLAPPRLPPEELARLEGWLAAGHQGRMDWLAHDPAARGDAGRLLEGAGAVLMVALPYAAPSAALPADGRRGWVARYAQPELDYHRVFAARLEGLKEFCAALLPGVATRRFCDTAPLLERAFAYQAGLGFFGKNTLLINARRGSATLLGGLIVAAPLPADGPAPLASCGACTRCLEACPTQAFPAPHVLDARRCVSYLTIEHRGPVPEELRAGVSRHVFGCDLCQAVCPFNERFAAAPDPELSPDPAREHPDLLELAAQATASFKGLARGTAFYRAGKTSFLRNLATAMGNAGDPACAPALRELAAHPDPAVSEHARWALRRVREEPST
ncbi:MAG: tRNA epoxyqueuosine(34) reductase QueG [Planctomycetota bacterium]